MIIGRPPYEDKNPYNIYKKIISTEVIYPNEMPEIARDLINRLLIKEHNKRLTEDGIKRHEFFRSIN